MSDGEKLRKPLVDGRNGFLEGLQQDDVAVDVTQQRRSCSFLGAHYEVVKQRSAKLITLNVVKVAELQFGGNPGGAGFFSE